MSDCKNVLIFGATGLVGRHIIQQILKGKNAFDRIAIFTSSDTVNSKSEEIAILKDQGVEVLVGNITDENDVKKAYQGVDTVISAVGRNMIEHQVELIRLADQTPNIHRFFPSEYGTDIEHGPESSGEKPHQRKLKVRASIRSCKNLDYTFLVTGPYADGDPVLYLSPNHGATITGSFDVRTKTAVLLGSGDLKIAFTTMTDVGKLLLAALTYPDVSRNKALKVKSFTTTDADLLEEFEKQTGGEKWKVSYTSIEELKRLEKEAWEMANPLATVITLRRIWATGGTLYDKWDNEAIGSPAVQSLAEAVAAAIDVQLHGERELKRKLV
ncbi:isoflavone reductase [Exophiala viscosa]|uniref:isoflavone reductase n=1 Tax=Exophiala viscosa TaxID=2486360 RepID=UPI00218E67D0|nr:isoflavone reductase [Exophiala viscosa]